jgi:hypothetical protein
MFNINNLKDIANFIPNFLWTHIYETLFISEKDKIIKLINEGKAVEIMSLKMRLETVSIVAIYRGTQPTIYLTFPDDKAHAALKSHYDSEKAKARRLAAKADFRKSKEFKEWAKHFIIAGDILQFTGTKSYSLRRVIKVDGSNVYGQQLDNNFREVGQTTSNGVDKISKIRNSTSGELEPIRKVYEACVK